MLQIHKCLLLLYSQVLAREVIFLSWLKSRKERNYKRTHQINLFSRTAQEESITAYKIQDSGLQTFSHLVSWAHLLGLNVQIRLF